MESREGLPLEHGDQAELQRRREELAHLARAWYDGQTPEGEPLTPENREPEMDAVVEATIEVAAREEGLERQQLRPETASAVRASLEIVSRLRELAEQRIYDPNIEVVHVYSGPGTYFDRIKPGQTERQRWLDRDRILAGVAVAREVAAAKFSQLGGMKLTVGEVSEENFVRIGPQLLYNGTPIENEAIQRALREGRSKVPSSKVTVRSEVREDDGSVHTIRHTADQARSLFQEVDDPKSTMYGRYNIAAVAHIPDFIRIPFYLEKLNQARRQAGVNELKFWAYALKSRRGSSQPGGRLDTVGEHMAGELTRLVKYLQRGDLAVESVRFENV